MATIKRFGQDPNWDETLLERLEEVFGPGCFDATTIEWYAAASRPPGSEDAAAPDRPPVQKLRMAGARELKNRGVSVFGRVG